MRKLKAKIRSKLKSNAGESLAEVLIALLIAALALTMLASVISTSARIITQSKAKMKNYYDANNVLESQTVKTDQPTLTITIHPVVVVEGEETVQSGVISLKQSGSTTVYSFENAVVGTKKVYSYKLKAEGGS